VSEELRTRTDARSQIFQERGIHSARSLTDSNLACEEPPKNLRCARPNQFNFTVASGVLVAPRRCSSSSCSNSAMRFS